jgi:hypothetical protein
MKKLLLATCLSLTLMGGALAQQSGEPGGASEAPKGPPDTIVPLPDLNKLNEFEPYLHIAPVKDKSTGMVTIFVWGEIKDGDASRFSNAMQMIPKPWNEVVILGSPGGSLPDGLEIGRIIHANHLATHLLANHNFRDPFGQCVSACNFVFLGGVIRRIDLGGKFTVHLFHRDLGPLAILDDMEKSNPSDSPRVAQDPKAPASSTARPTTNKQTFLTPLTSDDPPKVTEPGNLKSLGCDDINRIYTPEYDKDTQRTEISYEGGLKQAVDDIDLGKEHIKDKEQFNQLRALTIDYLCVEQNVARDAAEIAQFLIEMRMSIRFLEAFSNIANATPTPLSRDQLREYNIINVY